ncbi:FG-GAP-like repeat-containing protein [Roseiconus lacunae]|uniref:FG-GAP-like repeat-containing protein n=1 Tax=Roseiconus lacunae TaxID=2605694 RepID=A0ABT7PLB6_9BACT|nr:FG-GAP-like repeat-containing protein [Roseiconus lacunae]MDM4017293.1 FG-GAP-like repeat-containing protein [Roseiconus lacunae]
MLSRSPASGVPLVAAWDLVATVLLICGAVGCGKSDTETRLEDSSTSQMSPVTDDSSASNASATTADPSNESTVTKADTGSSDGDQTTTGEAHSGLAMSRERQIDAALNAQDDQRFGEAIAILQQLVLQDPKDYVCIFHLANAEAGRGNLELATELLAEIPPTAPDSGLPALGVAADWYMQLENYELAERRYRQILQLAPQFNIARRRLAFLLNRQGRRHEANALVRELCRAGDVMQDELFGLIVESDAMYDSAGGENDSVRSPRQTSAADDRLYRPIGPLAEARYEFTRQRYSRAVEILQPSIESGNASQAAIAFYGLAAAEGQLEQSFRQWFTSTNESTQVFPEYWSAIGTYLLRETRYREAVGALAEAIRLDASDHRSVRRLIQCFRSLDDPEKETAFQTRYKHLNRAISLGNEVADATEPKTRSDKMAELADQLIQLDRPLEAILWKSLALGAMPNHRTELQQLGQSLQTVVASRSGFPNAAQRWCGVDLSSFEKPRLSADDVDVASRDESLPKPTKRQAQPARFQNVAPDVNLNHGYDVATKPQPNRFAIYQQLGGGVAVIDYDLDGWGDLYLAQGAADPPKFEAERSNQLLRHIPGRATSLLDQTEAAGLTQRQYTIGVTSGDWNQDGFPDLAISNLGINQLWINRGDGTFDSRNLDRQADFERCVSSIAMGDLTGDHLPDLVALNYLRDPDLIRRPALDTDGNVAASIAPLEFQPALDSLYQNSVTGDFARRSIGNLPDDACTGLGVMIANVDQQLGNECFVGNDALQNQLWKQTQEGSLLDVAIATGCAYGAHSLATAAMGIAAADFDRSGTLDFHITNFSKEPVSLYLGRDGTFRDLAIRFGLAPESTPMVGFGTQPLDYDNDGWIDLIVTNGHVDDLGHKGETFRQPMQLFANLGDRFETIASDDDRYWNAPHLGRALASLDFNRDGRLDCVVTHIAEPTALLVNQTETDHHWLQLRLIGTASERDAVGAHVTVVAGDQQFEHWVCSGDGYLCKNESIIHVGLGDIPTVDQIIVRWPTGTREVFQMSDIDQRATLVEGQSGE